MKIPICLVTGFLGSGKTTILKHLVSRLKGKKVVYLINELNASDIDGSLIVDEGADVVAVPGGSIFCKCLVTQFINNLRDISKEHEGIEGVVIEASGMADPRVIEKMLKETGLDDSYVLSNILTVVDPGTYMKLRFTLPNVIAQVQSADCVVLNKVDLYSEEVLHETELALLEANPDASILRIDHGRYDDEVFPAPHSERNLSGDYALCRDPNYSTETLKPDGQMDIDILKSQILERSDTIYRVKGFVSASDGNDYHIDYSNSGFNSELVANANKESLLVVIYKGGSDCALKLN